MLADLAKEALSATAEGLTKAVFSLFGGGRERRIAFAKDRVPPIERSVATTRHHLERIRGILATWGEGAAYDDKIQIRAVRAWEDMMRELARLEKEARAAAEPVDPQLFRLLEDATRQGMRLYGLLLRTPTASRRRPEWHNPHPIAGPGDQPVVPAMPPARPGAPVRVLLRQLEEAQRANSRVAARLRRLLT
jgi:hypothetical protein